jgi:hypothetical protein
MAKNAFPMKTGGAVSKVVGLLVVCGVLALVIKHPSDAATWVTGAFQWLGTVIDGISAFLREVLG